MTTMENEKNKHSTYPIAIIESRYGGVYEGGKWHAIPCYKDIVKLNSYLEYRDGDDCDAIDFWDSIDSSFIGVGETPELAILDMELRISRIGLSDW